MGSLATRHMQKQKSKIKNSNIMGGRPGLVVMGGDSSPEGHGFESQHHILDGHFLS